MRIGGGRVASRALAVVLLASVLSCASSAALEERPVATVGQTPNAESHFRPLMRRWVLGSEAERQALDGKLKSFAERFHKDDLVRMARVLRAFNALDRGDAALARKLARQAHLGRAGVPRDLAQLVMGAVERRQGNHRKALEILAPLLHKMLDHFATTRLNEELVLASIGARRWPEALRYMEAWLREAEPGNENTVGDRVRALLARVPDSQLLAALERLSRAGGLEGDTDTAKLLAQQLAVQAVERRDAVLARALLDRHGPLLGRYGEAVARLAIDTATERVAARTVGLLSSLRTPGLRRRSADVVAGMSFGLDAARSGARLVTRDAGPDAEAVRAALNELASEGAAVVVAGIDPAHSAPAAAYARDTSLPVVLLTADETATSPFVFLLGEDRQRTAGALAAALRADGAKHVAGVGAPLGGSPPAGIESEHRCEELPGAGALQAARIDALVIYDGSECGPAATALAGAAGTRLAVGLGVPAVERAGLELAAGIFPLPEGGGRAKAWFDSARGELSWWSALGRDAAVLGWAAVRDLGEAASGEREVEARRVDATSALASAEAELWTSEARGFSGKQRLPRRIVVRGGDGRARP